MNKKLKQKLFFTLLIFCFISGSVLAQRAADKVVTYDKNIESILVNQFTGSIIIKDRDAISSYNPDTEQIEWKVADKDISSGNALKNTNDAINKIQNDDYLALLERKNDLVYFIDGSPFISLTIDGKDMILNSVTGEVMYNSSELGYRLLSSEFMLDERALLLTIINDKNYSVAYYDLETKEQKWVTELAPVASFFGSLKGLFSLNPEDATRDMVATTDKDVFVTISGMLYKIGKNDGVIAWKTNSKINTFEINDARTHIVSVRQTGNLFRRRTALNLLDINTGNKVWKDDIVTKYVTYLEDAGDKIAVAHESGFNFFQYADGKKVWKKDAKGKKIKQVIPIDEDYLYVADKEMNLIDKYGKNKWKKFVEICDKEEDEVYHLNKIDNNRVFYLSDAYGNMVDYTTGKKVWKKDVKFNRNRPLLYSYDADKNLYIAYNDNKIYRFDPNGKDEKKNEPFAKLSKVRDDGSMADIQLFDWGVSLIGEQDAIGVDFDGKVIYQNTYKEPGANKRGWGLFGRQAGSLILGGMMMKNAAQGTGKAIMTGSGEIPDAERDRINGSAFAMGAMHSSFVNKALERARVMKTNNEYAYMLNKAEKGGEELVKVRKSDGEEVDRLNLDGTKPIYEVDSYNDNLYYVKGKELRVYTKK